MNEKGLEAAARALAIEDRIHICSGAMYRYSTYGPRARSAIIAYLAAMEAEGFVMVPMEPTKAMLAQTSYVTGMNDAPMADWLAMIAARPQTEQKND